MIFSGLPDGRFSIAIHFSRRTFANTWFRGNICKSFYIENSIKKKKSSLARREHKLKTNIRKHIFLWKNKYLTWFCCFLKKGCWLLKKDFLIIKIVLSAFSDLCALFLWWLLMMDFYWYLFSFLNKLVEKFDSFSTTHLKTVIKT